MMNMEVFPVLRLVLLVVLVLMMVSLPCSFACGEERTTVSCSESEIVLERDGLKIWGKLYLPETEGPLPLVICCHGFGGNYEHVKAYAEAFARNGIAPVQ